MRKQSKAKRPRSKAGAIPPLHVKRSAELWLDVFSEVLPIYLGEDGETPPDRAVTNARLLADRAVDEFEQRWPGVKL
jgi:hypothetical protein